RGPVVVIKRKGPSPAIVFTITAIAALGAGFLILRLMRPAEEAPASPTAGATGTSPPTKAAETGLVHALSTPEPVLVYTSPLQGVDIDKLSKPEKDALLNKVVAEVKAHIARREGELARHAMEDLDKVAPNDARFYEIESQVLSLAIEMPPVP